MEEGQEIKEKLCKGMLSAVLENILSKNLNAYT